MPSSLFSPPPLAGTRPRHARRGFTLVEMLVVMGIIVVLMALLVPAFTSLNGSHNLTAGAYNITGALENARAYAKANNTYTWLGFYEEDFNKGGGASGEGRIILSTVASKDGTAMYNLSNDTNPKSLDSSDTYGPTGLTRAANLAQVGKLVKIENADIYSPTSTPASPLPTPPVKDYLVGDDKFATHAGVSNNTTFHYPIGSADGAANTYKFTKIIQFNPLGDAAKIVDSPTQIMEVDLQPTHGAVPDNNTKNRLAIQVAGIGGQVRLYQP